MVFAPERQTVRWSLKVRFGSNLVFADAVCIPANVCVQWLQQIRAARDTVRRAVPTLAMIRPRGGRRERAERAVARVRGRGLTLTGRIRTQLGLGVRLGLGAPG